MEVPDKKMEESGVSGIEEVENTVTKIFNYTGSPINFLDDSDITYKSIESSGKAEAKPESSKVKEIDGIAIHETVYGEIVGLPDKADLDPNAIYIVSAIIAKILDGQGVSDNIYVPYKTIRKKGVDSGPKISGCKGLMKLTTF